MDIILLSCVPRPVYVYVASPAIDVMAPRRFASISCLLRFEVLRWGVQVLCLVLANVSQLALKEG